jgi:hypothetical protein
MTTADIELDDWQKDILAHDGNFLLCTGRQVGKTTIFAIKAAEYLVKHKDRQIIIVSLTEDQAKLIIIMILDYLEKHYPKMIAKGKHKPTQNKIALINKSTALARPVGTTGDALRGFTGHVLIIDEASRMPALVWEASKPTLLTTAGQIWLCSTPHGKQGYFWEAFQNKNDRFRVFHISSEEVIKNRPISKSWTKIKQEMAIKFLEEEKKDMSTLQYGQEYLGLFLDELRQYFSDEIINKCCILKRPSQNNQETPKEHNYLGVDIARMGKDATTYEILHSPPNRKTIVHIEGIVKFKQLTTKTETDIIELNSQFNPVKIGIDAGSGSLGVGIFDRLLENPLIKRKVIAMNNRQISLDHRKETKQRIFKEDMYENLLNLMEKGEILLLDDEDLILSLRSVQWELEDRTGLTKVRIFGNDTHRVEGLIRSAWLAKKEKSKNLTISYM